MAQSIKVQDGYIVLSSADPQFDVNVDVKGELNVTKQLFVGNDTSAPGTITSSLDTTTEIGQDLIITTANGLNGGGNLSLIPSGALILNGYQWPTGSIPATPGSYLGATSSNTLEFLQFTYAYTSNDSMTVSELNTAYPNILSGQNVVGNTVIYQCVSPGVWRTLGSPLGYSAVNIAGDTMTGYLILNADPVNNLGAATKQYVDNIASGLSTIGACETATSTSLPACTYNNGSAGVGATLTSNVNSTLGTVGGYSGLIVGSRVLVKNQASQIQNGIYEVTSLGSVSTQWILTRTSDFDGSPTTEINAGDLTYIQFGTLAGTQWIETATGTGPSGAIVVGTNNIIFTQFSGAGTYIAGNGIDISSNVISNLGVTSVGVSGGSTGLIFSSSPVTTTGTMTMSGTLSISSGGTGQLTANGAFNALAPSQSTNSGKLLTTNGTNTSWSNNIWITPAGSVAIGPAVTASELPTTATDGFFYIPTCAGTPTGTPTNIPGRLPMVIDSVNGRFYIYVNGAWKAINIATYL